VLSALVGLIHGSITSEQAFAFYFTFGAFRLL